MIKLTNSHMSSKFQGFKDEIISHFRVKPVVQDLDLIRLSENNISQLIEVKKSKKTSYAWKPFTIKNFPNFDYSRLDDFNYKALYALGVELNVKVWIYHYTQDYLVDEGINFYRILDSNLNMSERSTYSLQYFQSNIKGKPSSKCEKRNSNKVKDFDNPNIAINQNNLFYVFQTNQVLKNHYYVEYGGIWTMLVSNPVSYKPLWLYIEVDIEASGIDLDKVILKDEFFPQIEIYEKTNTPLSIISYNYDMTKFIVYEYKHGSFNRVEMNSSEIKNYYGSYIQLLNQ